MVLKGKRVHLSSCCHLPLLLGIEPALPPILLCFLKKVTYSSTKTVLLYLLEMTVRNSGEKPKTETQNWVSFTRKQSLELWEEKSMPFIHVSIRDEHRAVLVHRTEGCTCGWFSVQVSANSIKGKKNDM